MSQSFVVNTTLGFVRFGRVLFLPPGGRDLPITFRLSRAARVAVTVETASGVLVRTITRRSYPAGEVALAWNGIRSDRKPVVGGRYVVRVVARNATGTVTQAKPLVVRRVRG
jgi:flagellar hook assembly protein FlgD